MLPEFASNEYTFLIFDATNTSPSTINGGVIAPSNAIPPGWYLKNSDAEGNGYIHFNSNMCTFSALI